MGNPKGKRPLVNLEIDGRTILKRKSKKRDGEYGRDGSVSGYGDRLL